MQQRIHPKIEKTLRQIILKDLSKGRGDFDRQHTEAVVYWMKHLLENDPEVIAAIKKKSLNPKVLITAAYAHDWGYYGLFKKSEQNDFAAIKKRKPLHMQIGAAKIEQLLFSRLTKQFSDTEILEIAHLVRFHDALEALKTESEILLMECDTLGMLDVDRVTPSFSPEDNAQFMKTGIHGRRLPIFKHKYALEIAERLVQKREAFYAAAG